MKYATVGGEVTHIIIACPSVKDMTLFRRLMNHHEGLGEFGLFGSFQALVESSLNTGKELVVEKQKMADFHDEFVLAITSFVSDEYRTPQNLAKNLGEELVNDSYFRNFLEHLQIALRIPARDL